MRYDNITDVVSSHYDSDVCCDVPVENRKYLGERE